MLRRVAHPGDPRSEAHLFGQVPGRPGAAEASPRAMDVQLPTRHAGTSTDFPSSFFIGVQLFYNVVLSFHCTASEAELPVL